MHQAIACDQIQKLDKFFSSNTIDEVLTKYTN
jgi:hypothetical protein